MSGDYTKFSFKRRDRFSALLQQQGRVHLDSDFNEAIEILRRRTRVQALDTFGEFGVAQLTTPDAFKIGIIAGPPTDLSIQPGRVYVHGWLAELFADESASYLKQPFLPDPPALPAGDAVVYLDVRQRELTYIEHPPLLDSALLGVDTTTRLQTIWQLRVEAYPGAVCGLPVGKPPSAARLTTEAIAPPTPDDPCVLPPIAGYRGLENRLYRIEIHDGGALGTARFKWSRDNGSIVSAVTDIATAGGQTTLTVNRIGRDQFLRFAIDNWVTVTDDVRELMDEPGEMARVVDIDETHSRIVLDRALPGAGRPFGATANDIATRHTRVQKWDQSAATNVVDADGLILTGPGPIDIEAGIRVRFDVDPAGGLMNQADFWAFWARTATASIEILNKEPPRGIKHHYVQLAAITGLGGPAPFPTDCRPPPAVAPPPGHEEKCCCTIVVAVGEDIQKGINSLPDPGGCVCLKTGVHVIRTTLVIARSHVKLVGESPGAIVRGPAEAALLIDGRKTRVEGVEIETIQFECERVTPQLPGVVTVIGAQRSSIIDCGAAANDPRQAFGIVLSGTSNFRVTQCRITTVEGGVLVTGRGTGEVWIEDNQLELSSGNDNAPPAVGILVQQDFAPCRIERNLVMGAVDGIIINDQLVGAPQSDAAGSLVRENQVICAPQPPSLAASPPAFGIDVAADACVVAENAVVMNAAINQSPAAIRVTGAAMQVSDNDVRVVSTSTGKPAGLQIGFSDGTTTTPTQAVVARGNQLVGAPIGIAVTDAMDVQIDGNTIETSNGDPAAITNGDVGVSLVRSSRCIVRDNHVSRSAIGIASDTGAMNQIAGNILTTGGAGVSAQKETGPIVAQNRILAMSGSAISLSGNGRFDVVGNRITNCAFGSDFGVAIGALSILGELHIEANEVMDTGLSPDGTLRASIAFGIGAGLILEARVESNLVTYSNPASRSPSGEDRALSMMGLMEVHAAGAPVAGFAIQIIGNKFLGFGRSALVELTQLHPSDPVFNRFERVLFHNNHCTHLTPADIANDPGATVVLVGNAASVVGNHIKAVTRGFPSFDFSNMPGPCIGNVLNGPILRQGTTPPLDSNFNMNIF